MAKLLIYTAADGDYINYAPLWEWCIRDVYPEYDCIVHKIENHNSKRVVRYFAAVYRFLILPSEDFEYIYITDIDMMHIKQTPGVFEYHKLNMDTQKLCYSNQLRTKEILGSERMTGLHFCSKEWYTRTEDARSGYLHMLEQGEIGNGRFDDELVLKKICVKSGVGLPMSIGSLVNRHFGIHLGTLRAYRHHPRGKINQQLRMRISPKAAQCWIKNYSNDVFSGIIKNTKRASKEIAWEIDTLFSFCMRRIKEGG